MSGNTKKNIPTIRSTPKETTPQGITASNFHIPKWAPYAVVLFTALLYFKALSGGLTSIDDDFYITRNPYLRDFSWHGIKEIFTSFYQTNYHPLTTLIYFFEFHWFGLEPLPYHLLSVLLHLVNTLLVFKLAEELSGKRLTALIVCVLFAVHPMHVESVAWVAELKDVLYSMFYLSSLLFYVRFLKTDFNRKYYVIALLLFVASLFSKSAAVTLPLILIIIDLYRGRKINAALVLEKTPFLLLSILFGILAILSQRAGGAINDYTISVGFVNKLFIFTSAVSFYIIKVIAPFGLSVLHYSPYVLGTLQWQHYASLPFVLVIAWLVLRPSPFRKELIFGFSFFIAALSVMLQIIPVGSAYVAERYTYLAYIGLFYVMGQGLGAIDQKKRQHVILIVSSVVVLAFSYMTWDRIGVWKDDTAVFNDLVNSNPDIYSTYSLRGDVKKNQGDPQGALEDYTKSIELNPNFADTYYKRGSLYDMMNNIKSAMADYSRTIQLRPDFGDAYNNRGWDLYRSGNAKAAMEDLNKAISLSPNNATAYNNRGWILYQGGDTKSAVADFSKAIALVPGFDKPYYNRADIRFKSGDFPGAADDFNSIVKIHPDDAAIYYRRAMAYMNMKDNSSACRDWKKASELGNSEAAQMLQQYCK